jgi:nitrogen fixation protein NifU and related proteins
MPYSEKLLDYFQNPRCVGELADASAVAEVSNPVCGDVMKLWVRVEDGKIVDARFKAQGCSAAIATSSYATEMIIGRDVADALKITKDDIADALGGLPASKIHCSVLACDAIKGALK